MRKLLITATLFLAACASASRDTTVVLLHFSDYHSHAVPFYTERGPSQGGIARAIGYLEREKKRGALVFSGGDMMNKGAPSWSDKYGCVEWPWLNGIVDAMALGNHDVDYGAEAFEKCKETVRYPILSANTEGFEGTRVLRANGRRIGVFAVAGPDLPRLMKASGLRFSDPIEAARRAVASLEAQKVDAIVMIGHQQTADDYALAKAVPGIDLIFGTHAHIERALVQVPGATTWFIAGGQYLESISRVEIGFGTHGVKVSGRLVPVDASMRESGRVARRVAKMQRDLEGDPRYREMFEPVAHLGKPMSTREVAALALRVMREETFAHVSLSTVSSFRGPLDAGPLTREELTAALPYDNEVVVCSMFAFDVRRLVENASGREGDLRAYVDFDVNRPEVEKLSVATTDYMARAYGALFPCKLTPHGFGVRAAVLRKLAPQ